jgi:alkylation response protein AidB-like acyl-CoA dehydrogenase
MDFSVFTDVPRYSAFLKEVTSFLDEIVDDEFQRQVVERHDEHHPDFFRALGERGWVIPWLPVDEGGADLDYREVEILDAEIYRRNAPFLNLSTTRMTFPVLQEFGQSPFRESAMREVLSGETAIVLGYTEPSGGSDIAHVSTSATQLPSGDWLVNGAKAFISGAHHAKYALLLVSTDPQAPKRKGLTMFMLPLDLPGIQVTAQETLFERTNMVSLEDVVVPDIHRLGDPGAGWRVLSGPLAEEHGTHGAKERPNGYLALSYPRKLHLAFTAAFQLASHGFGADLLDDPLFYRTIGRVATLVESGATAVGLSGKIVASQNFIEGSSLLVDLVGDAALVPGLDPAGLVERSYRRSHVSTIYGGSVEVYKNLVARELGLPRPAYWC